MECDIVDVISSKMKSVEQMKASEEVSGVGVVYSS